MKVTQADLGAAVMKVGGGLLGGMRTLRASASGEVRQDGRTHSFREARRVRNQPRKTLVARIDIEGSTSSPSRGVAFSTFKPLSSNTERKPETTAEFITLDDQPISKLTFLAADGTCVLVAPLDGTWFESSAFDLQDLRESLQQTPPLQGLSASSRKHVGGAGRYTSLFWIHAYPNPRLMFFKHICRGTIAGSGDGGASSLRITESDPWHIYNVRPGRNAGVTGDMVWNADGRRNLTIHSQARQLLPSTVYLYHQFHFYALGEDHCSARILRGPIHGDQGSKEVQVDAYTSGHGESFVQASTTPQEIQGALPSFDEPLASAIPADLDYSETSPSVIAILPIEGASRSDENIAHPTQKKNTVVTHAATEGGLVAHVMERTPNTTNDKTVIVPTITDRRVPSSFPVVYVQAVVNPTRTVDKNSTWAMFPTFDEVPNCSSWAARAAPANT
ncbi:hypothetical protein BD410DRAFT_845793 [Rickenella mellea]|uniref:Uncharacterized protein n=1 Tax=Rickenella mellea TaxID=50990 RepID=A0A4Y7PJV7_9AGAM|nr:hypothetical protein BD410DRAFT_845793 [Rickenella mellea]